MLPKIAADVLEIGCATGSLLAVARAAGHRVTGIDLSPRFVQVARNTHHLNVDVADVAQASFPNGAFDLIILFGTLSNLQHPQENLRQISRWLKPGGHLVANFPAADSGTARIYGKRFWMFAPTGSTIFTRAGCRLALAHAGYDRIRIRRDLQRPSLSKIAVLSRLPWLQSVVRRFKLQDASLPCSLPIPSVRFVRAQKPD